jgi:di/tricarboxylate transporter
LITLGQASGIPPARMVVPTIMAIALAYMLPSASARMTLAAVTGAVERKNMIRAGLVVGVPSAIVVILFFYLASQLGLI